MTSEAGLRLTLVPYVYLAFAIVSIGLLLLLVVMTPVILIDSSATERAVPWYIFPFSALIFLGSSWLTVSLTRQNWGTLTIGTEIEYRRRWGNLHLRLPREAAHHVTIGRPGLRIRRPTNYRLHVDIRGKLYSIPFAEHWMFGSRKFQLAQQIAADLGVPIRDPSGERDRASRLLFIRWLGRGEEWKFALAVLLAMAVFALVIRIG